MNVLGKYHPFVNLIYFVLVIGFSCFFMHPLCLGISLVCIILYMCASMGVKKAVSTFLKILPFVIITALINPLFNHRGVTVLMYLPGGNPLTLESVVYGICTGVMVACVMLWFSEFGRVMTSDRIIYLFGRVMPSFSLIISMTLRFVPRFFRELSNVADAQRCIGRDVTKGSISQRARSGLDILSAMITRSLESSVVTADSMKARGYGLSDRTAFAIYKFSKRDAAALVYIVFAGVYTLFGGISGAVSCSYFPYYNSSTAGLYGASVLFAYLLLCIFPAALHCAEVIYWKASESKI